MAFTPVFSILIFVVLVLVVGISAIAIYLVNYNRRINKQLSEGNISVKKRMSPAAVAVLVISVILVSVIIITIVTAVVSAAAYITNKDSSHTIDFDCQSFTNEDILDSEYYYFKDSSHTMDFDCQSFTNEDILDSEYYYFAEAYEKGKMSNTSYSVETKIKGDFEYTLFRKEQNYYSSMSPAFALFVKYIGDADYKGFAECMELTSTNGSGIWSDYGKTEKYYCVFGNADNADFDFTLSMFKDSKTGEKNFESMSNNDDIKDTTLKNADEVFELTISNINPE